MKSVAFVISLVFSTFVLAQAGPHLRAATVFSALPIGHVWKRSITRPASDGRAADDNPAARSKDSLVWKYESVARGMGLGEPTSGGRAPNPWYDGNPAKLTWDSSLRGWSYGDHGAPLINSTSLIETLNNTRVPVVRWVNSTGRPVTVALSGVLSLSWNPGRGSALLQPIEFMMMLEQHEGSINPLVIANRKPVDYPQKSQKDARDIPKILIDLPAVQVPAGGSIFYTMRYEGVEQVGSVTLNDSNLTVTLKAPACVPLTADDTAVTDQNEMVNVEVLANDEWAPQTLPRVSILKVPSHGVAVVRADQSVDYTPAANFAGTDTLTYQLYDGASANTATVTITVNRPYYLYVSPEGSDANSGTSWSSALATLDGARTKVRALRSSVNGRAFEVELDDGVYGIDHTVQFDSTDSGTARYPVTYRARNPLSAAISGGKMLKLLWQPYAAMPGVYVADLKAAGLNQTSFNTIHTLIVNGLRAVRARLPRSGFYTVVSADPDITHVHNKTNSFTFGDTNRGQQDIQSTWKNLTNVEIVSYAAWTESRMRIASVDAANHQVHIQGALTHSWANDYLADYGAYRNANHKQTGATDGTIRYYIENVLEGLNAPGEWYLDSKAEKLYYYPRVGEAISTASFVVPMVDQLIRMTGTTNVRFDGLAFRDTGWTMPAAGQPGDQEAIFVSTPNAISLSGTSNIVFSNGLVTNTGGGYCIQIQFGATGNSIVNTEFVNNGGGGIMIGGNPDRENDGKSYVGNNRVSLNRIHDNDAVWREATGICAVRSGYNRITGNTISNVTYSGIDIGWFDFDPLAAGHNRIAWNTISNFGRLLYDLGGIYVLGAQPYTTIMDNRISGGLWTANHLHRYKGQNANGDKTSESGPLAGIYTDETSSGELIQGNVISNTNQGIFFHQSRDQIVTSNILVDIGSTTWSTFYIGNSQGTEHAGPLWLASNVIAWTQSLAAPIRLIDGYMKTNPWYALDHDIISYGPAKVENPSSYGLPALRSTGHDLHAVVTNRRLFVNTSGKDYRISVSSRLLAQRQGFFADWLMESKLPIFTSRSSAWRGAIRH